MSLEDLSTDQLLARAKEMESSHTLVQSLAKDPEARNLFQRYLKKKNPNLAIPEIDSEDRMLKLLEDERTERKKLEDKIREDELRRRVEADKQQAQAKYKLTDEEMKGVEALMVKSEANPEPLPPIYDVAARVFKASHTASVPTPSLLSPPTYSMPEKEVWSKGIGNASQLNRIALEQAYAAFNDIKGGKVAQ